MFKHPKRLLLSATLLCAIAFSGCATVDKALTVEAKQPVTVTGTNAAGQPFTASYIPLEPNPALLPYKQTGEAIIPLLPTPAREVAGGVLGLLVGAATLYIRTRNQIKESEAVNQTLIKTIELNDSKALKQEAQKISILDGTKKALAKRVNAA